MTDNNTQVAVIGGGPGGYAAAFMAADLGLKTTLINPDENPGGVCLYRGCIPSKALLHAAKVITEAKEAKAFGLSFSELKIDSEKLQSWKKKVVAQMTGGLGQLAKQKKVEYIQGNALFADNHTLDIQATKGDGRKLTFEHAIIATGSYPVRLKQLDIDSAHLWDSTDALELSTIPKRLLVIGGGYIGLELGSVYAALGSQVHVAEMTPNLLPGADKDLVRFLKKAVSQRFETVHLKTTVKSLKEVKDGIQVTMEGPETDSKPQQFNKVLMSVGRRPNSSGLGLENTRVKINEKGFIEIDGQRRTAESHIFAIGDVAGEPMLAHKATHEGRTVAEVITGKKVFFEPAGIPAVVFTDPEIAWVGLTEEEAKERSIKVKVVRFPWAASGRAATLGRSDGLSKLLVDPETERILGVGIVGPGAGEMIAEGALALEMAANATDLGLTIHPHPTLSETIMEAADIFHGLSTHFHAPRRK
jgi:dihydrolipoamide dehydrogenase